MGVDMKMVVHYYQQVILSSGMIIEEDLENLTLPSYKSEFNEWKRKHLSISIGTIILGLMSFFSKNFTIPAIQCSIKVVSPITSNIKSIILMKKYKNSGMKLISCLNQVHRKYSEAHILVKSLKTEIVTEDKQKNKISLTSQNDEIMSLTQLMKLFELNLRKSIIAIMRALIEDVEDLYQIDLDYLEESDNSAVIDSENIDNALIIIFASRERFVLIRSHFLSLIYLTMSLGKNMKLFEGVIFKKIENLMDEMNRGVIKIDHKMSQIRYPLFRPLNLLNFMSIIETKEKPHIKILMKTIEQLSLKASHVVNDLKLLVDSTEKVETLTELKTLEERISKLAKMLKECHSSCVDTRKLLEVINKKGEDNSKLPVTQKEDNLQEESESTYEIIDDSTDDEIEVLQQFGDEISDDDFEEDNEITKQPILIELRQCQAFIDRQVKFHTLKRAKQPNEGECIDNEITSHAKDNLRNSSSISPQLQTPIKTNLVGSTPPRVPPPPPPIFIDLTSDDSSRSALIDSIQDALATRFVSRSEDTFQ